LRANPALVAELRADRALVAHRLAPVDALLDAILPGEALGLAIALKLLAAEAIGLLALDLALRLASGDRALVDRALLDLGDALDPRLLLADALLSGHALRPQALLALRLRHFDALLALRTLHLHALLALRARHLNALLALRARNLDTLLALWARNLDTLLALWPLHLHALLALRCLDALRARLAALLAAAGLSPLGLGLLACSGAIFLVPAALGLGRSGDCKRRDSGDQDSPGHRSNPCNITIISSDSGTARLIAT
jgi:hypothetical protein